MNQFQKQMDLNDAVDRWKKRPAREKTWDLFKKFFHKETKKNRNIQGSFKAIGLANAVTHQLGEINRENQQILTANSIQQNNVIEALVAKIEAMETAATTPPPPPPPPPSQANAATTANDANAKMMEIMMAMMNKMNAGGAGASAKTGNQSQNRQLGDNDKNGKRNTRRYNNDNYCWTCGFDISHTSMVCKYTNGNVDHKKEATAANTMGGSQRNMHLRTTS
jgi:hypothetical protein